ncbi:MAG: ADP-ribosylglycohydrolase family protein [Planctomycetes bacterium]|nr:ADP-ribosylglycohydrolase family protein [Planctomycetota bacterium]
MHPLFNVIVEQIKTDITQMVEDGHDEAALTRQLESIAAKGSFDSLLAFQQELWDRPLNPRLDCVEPDDWDMIISTFPDPVSHAPYRGSDADLADQLLAAWQGRCAGCMLGKPLEGIHWPDRMKSVIQAAGSWPLMDYMNPLPEGLSPRQVSGIEHFEKRPWTNDMLRGRFSAMPSDDDIHYSITSLMVLEQHGGDFTPNQAAELVAFQTPIACLWASGKRMAINRLFGLDAPFTALAGNPRRQSLGAMIRCDPYGWCAPGNPALAARWAFKDAFASQRRNGIYAGIFFAVLLADVLAHRDVEKAIDTAAGYVPPRSRFAEIVKLTGDLCRKEQSWEAVNLDIQGRYRQQTQEFNHALPNAAIVLIGLLKGGGDFSKTIGIAVMCGVDTDCTGATAGSIMGCALGTAGIPKHWTGPLNDTILTQIVNLDKVKISEMARRTFEVARNRARRG